MASKDSFIFGKANDQLGYPPQFEFSLIDPPSKESDEIDPALVKALLLCGAAFLATIIIRSVNKKQNR